MNFPVLCITVVLVALLKLGTPDLGGYKPKFALASVESVTIAQSPYQLTATRRGFKSHQALYSSTP